MKTATLQDIPLIHEIFVPRERNPFKFDPVSITGSQDGFVEYSIQLADGKWTRFPHLKSRDLESFLGLYQNSSDVARSLGISQGAVVDGSYLDPEKLKAEQYEWENKFRETSWAEERDADDATDLEDES